MKRTSIASIARSLDTSVPELLEVARAAGIEGLNPQSRVTWQIADKIEAAWERATDETP
jgi:hypothetical protein